MDYLSAKNWLLSRPDYQHLGAGAYNPGLEVINKLLDWWGHPEKKVPVIHVAGTNGKGSVSHILASVLQENHFKVGLYTSPHLKDFRERIKINGVVVKEDFVVSFVERIQPLMETLKPTFFELTTAMAFAYFDLERVEIAVIETGLGGRLDATNAVTPIVSVITSVGMDHVEILGKSLLEIAAEKAGIIKEEVPVVIGDVPDEVIAVFEDVAKKRKVKIHRATSVKIKSDLTASYQQKNLNTANAVLEILKTKKWQLNKTDVSNGFLNVVINTGLQGRMQTMGEEPLIIADAAHNGQGITALMNEISNIKHEKLHIVFGAASDKNLTEIFELFPAKAKYYFTEINSPRSQKNEVFREYGEAKGMNFKTYFKSNEALADAKASAGKNDLILICGSFYLLAEVL